MTSLSTSPMLQRVASVIALAILAACSGGGSSSSDNLVVNGDVPLVYVKRSTALRINPTDGTGSAAGGDLMLREKSSPSAPEHNLTARFTNGLGDAGRKCLHESDLTCDWVSATLSEGSRSTRNVSSGCRPLIALKTIDPSAMPSTRGTGLCGPRRHSGTRTPGRSFAVTQ